MEKEDRAEKLSQVDSLKLEELKKLSSELKSKSAMSHSEYDDGRLHLENLTNIDGLILPKKIDGRLHLENLTNIDGLILPKKIGDEEEFEPLDETDDKHKTR